MAIEFVQMSHPVTGGNARASREAFEKVWKPKGWELAEGEIKVDVPNEPEDTGTEGDLDTWNVDPMTHDE